MLVFTRRVGEQIVIGHAVRVIVVAVQGNKVRIGVSAPESIRVDREEIRARREQSAPRQPGAGLEPGVVTQGLPSQGRLTGTNRLLRRRRRQRSGSAIRSM